MLNFHEHRPDGLGVIDFGSLLLGLACPLNRSEWLYCLAYLNMESCIVDNRRVIVFFSNLSKMSKITAFGGLELQLYLFKVEWQILSKPVYRCLLGVV